MWGIGKSWRPLAVVVAATAAFAVVTATGSAFSSGDINLDQCANGTDADVSTSACNGAGTDWINGNLGESKTVYRETNSVLFRMTLTNLPAGPHTAIIEYDTLQGSNHAYDYLTDWNRTVTDAEPCAGIAGCAGPPIYAPLPIDPLVGGAGWVGTPLPQSVRRMAADGSTVSALATTLGTTSTGKQQINITFTTSGSSSTVVLAWGGHMGAQINWGVGNAAGAIPGSPYHMRVISVDGTGGNEDRSLKAAAIAPIPTITTEASSASILTGASVTDTAQISGPNGAPTGVVNFWLCGPNISGGTPDCTTGGTAVGSTVVGLTGQAISPATQINSPGRYCFRAEYVPDAFALYSPFNHTNTTLSNPDPTIFGECFDATVPVATLTLVKVVDNASGGGSKTVADFPLTATGPSTITGVSGTAAVTNAVVKAGTYALSETTQTGYTASAWNCVGGSLVGSNVTLGLDQSATCTITNTAKPAHLTLVKIVSGGSKTVADFPLTATGPSTITGVSGTAAVTNAVVKAGTYALSETTQTGYTASAWNCVGGSLVGSNVTLGLDQSATCTITNTAQPAHLTLVKVVTNDNGGTKTVADFPLTATGPSTITGVSGTAAVTDQAVPAGAYVLSETTQTGYTASAWNCVGGSLVGSTVTLGLGVSATCTINNNDDAPALHLRKTVTNDNGGVALPSGWTLTATGALGSPTNLSGTTPVDSSTGFKADTYALAESGGPSGYTAGTWACVLTGTATPVTVTNAHVTVGLGQDVTCTINNDDNASPPPPVIPVPPKTDVAIQKDATAQVTLGSNGQATIVYDFAVKNNGPDPAANVTVSDPAPSGVTFASVAQQPSQGSCSIQSGGALLTCSIGTLAVGQSVAIKVNATVTQTGTITNTGTTTTTTPDTNPANNTDSAQTLVVAPVKPPGQAAGGGPGDLQHGDGDAEDAQGQRQDARRSA